MLRLICKEQEVALSPHKFWIVSVWKTVIGGVSTTPFDTGNSEGRGGGTIVSGAAVRICGFVVAVAARITVPANVTASITVLGGVGGNTGSSDKMHLRSGVITVFRCKEIGGNMQSYHYDTSTGKITRRFSMPNLYYAEAQPLLSGEARYTSDDTIGSGGSEEVTHYFVDGVPTARPPMTLVTTGLVTTGIPTGTLVSVEDIGGVITEYTITDGEMDFTGSTEGTYQVTLTNFPYLDKTIKVVV